MTFEGVVKVNVAVPLNILAKFSFVFVLVVPECKDAPFVLALDDKVLVRSVDTQRLVWLERLVELLD